MRLIASAIALPRSMPAATSLPRLTTANPDVALNVLHGRPGEDGTLQGVLEILGIPYTHSGVLSSAVAMHKGYAKAIFRAAGIPVAEDIVASRLEAAKQHLMAPPYVIKPMAEGSSVGVFIVTEDQPHPPQELYREDWAFGDRDPDRTLHPGQRTDLRGNRRPGARRDRYRAGHCVL